jgi:hypothetical protein
MQNNIVHRIGPGQCYSADPVRFRQPRRLPTARRATARQAGAVLTALSRLRLRCRCRVSLLLHVPPPTMQSAASPLLATCWSSPLFFIPLLLYPAHSRALAAESTAASLCSVTSHPKPTTALPTDPSNSTTDRSSDPSNSTTEHLHMHRCLRSSSIPATTP